MMSRREWQEQKLAKGLCPECGRNPRGDKTQLCEPCRERRNARVRTRRAKRLERERCIECGVHEVEGRIRCRACKDRRNAMQRTWRAAPINPPAAPAPTPAAELAPIGPLRGKKVKLGVQDNAPIAARSVSNYELRKLGWWRP